MSTSADTAGLYLHIPFCSAVCPYCDFAVQVGGASLRSAFVSALLDEIALWADWPHPIDTVYFGGGTPSLLTSAELEQIVHKATERLPIEDAYRLFLEANPEDVNSQNLAAWRGLGVDTLSLGIQSFDDAELKRLGRRHCAADAVRAVEAAREAGFATVSLDLIFGIPGQSAVTWERNLRQSMALQPDHISCYQLTVHEGTTFGRWRDRGRLVEMPEDEQAELFELTHTRLAQGGWQAYEVSNFACGEAHRSRHNQKYWSHAPYLGVGPSAHSYADGKRWWNERDLGRYQAGVHQGVRPVAGSEVLGPQDLALEMLMLRLRTVDGFDLRELSALCGVDVAARNAVLLSSLQAQGYLRVDASQVHPTVKGLGVADGLAAKFLLS